MLLLLAETKGYERHFDGIFTSSNNVYMFFIEFLYWLHVLSKSDIFCEVSDQGWAKNFTNCTDVFWEKGAAPPFLH